MKQWDLTKQVCNTWWFKRQNKVWAMNGGWFVWKWAIHLQFMAVLQGKLDHQIWDLGLTLFLASPGTLTRLENPNVYMGRIWCNHWTRTGWFSNTISNWLMVQQPSWKIWVRQWCWDYPIYEMENNPNVWNHQSANPTELKSPSPSSNPSSLRADSSTWMQLVIRDTYFGGRRPDLHSRLLQPIVGQWWPGEIDDVTSPLRQSSSTISGMFGEYLPWFTYNCVITIKPSWHRPI